MALDNAIDQMRKLADAARCDDGDGHGVTNRAGEFDIEPLLGAVPVHGSQ